MKVFITGATGFIGKHLVRKLVNEGNDITINLFKEEVSPFDMNVKTYKLNENDFERDIEFFKNEKFDGIFHLASLYLTVHKPEQAVKLIDSNVRFSTYILECASQAKIKWFINTGTFWQHYQNSGYSPVNLYAATKQAFESIAQYYIDTNKIKFCTLKLSDTYGPNDTRPKIFNLWVKYAKSKKTLEMSKGEQIMDITYIDDIVTAFKRLADHLQKMNNEIKNGAVYAIKANERFSLKELSVVFEKVIGMTLSINWGKKPYKKREVMVPWDKGEVVPGWSPKTSIYEGIKNILKN